MRFAPALTVLLVVPAVVVSPAASAQDDPAPPSDLRIPEEFRGPYDPDPDLRVPEIFRDSADGLARELDSPVEDDAPLRVPAIFREPAHLGRGLAAP